MKHQPHSDRKPIWQRINKLFLFVVAIPTLISTLYFGLIASGVYISQSKFIIYNPQTASTPTGLGGILQGVGIGNTSNNAANAVHDYLTSRDALLDLDRTLQYRKTVSNSSIDPFNRFGGWFWFDTSNEQLYRYYTRMGGDQVDSTTNISTLNIEAYTARDAERVDAELLRLAQNLINRMNGRANRASVQYYEQQVQRAEQRALSASAALANYRNSAKLFSPNPEASQQAKLIGDLRSKLLQTQVRLSALESSAPSNPQLGTLRQSVKALKLQISHETSKITGSDSSLATKSIKYEQLALAQHFAETRLTEDLQLLAQANTIAQKQQLFIETIVKPNLPDEAIRPRRWRGVLATFVITLLVWGVLSVILAGVREHHER